MTAAAHVTTSSPRPASRPLSALPYARGLPLVGSAVPMFLGPIPFLLGEYRRLGPIFRLRAAHHRFTVLAGPEANALLSKTADRHLKAEPSWHDFSASFGAEHILPGVDGAEHYRLRKLQQRAYSRGAIARRLPEAAAIAQRTFARYPPGPVALVPMCRALVTEQLGVLTLGRGPGDHLDDVVQTMRAAMNCTITGQWPPVLLRLPRFQRARRRFLDMARSIRDAHAEGSLRSELLDDLRDAVAADPTFLSERDQLMMCTGPFVAGLDTVANTCAFLLYALLREPEAYRRVEAEADALLADPEALTPERLDEARAIRGAVLETLRLYPIAPMLYRHVGQPFDFGGYHLPTGEPVLFATTILHHLPEHFARPERFDVDRYEGDGRAMPCTFGLGPHTCLGSGFAEVQMALLAATFLRYARFALDPKAGTPRVRTDPSQTVGHRYTVRLVERR